MQIYKYIERSIIRFLYIKAEKKRNVFLEKHDPRQKGYVSGIEIKKEKRKDICPHINTDKTQ